MKISIKKQSFAFVLYTILMLLPASSVMASGGSCFNSLKDPIVGVWNLKQKDLVVPGDVDLSGEGVVQFNVGGTGLYNNQYYIGTTGFLLLPGSAIWQRISLKTYKVKVFSVLTAPSPSGTLPTIAINRTVCEATVKMSNDCSKLTFDTTDCRLYDITDTKLEGSFTTIDHTEGVLYKMGF